MSREDVGFVTARFSPQLFMACGLLNLSLTAPLGAANNVASLKDAFESDFLIGTILSNDVLAGNDATSEALARFHFNAFTAENAMKPASIQPEEGRFNFKEADRFVEIARQCEAMVVGHTLVWNQQTPPWFFEASGGQPASRELVLDRMRTHIAAVVGRYRGRIKQWDVVNEALSDEEVFLRESPWLKAIGQDYIAEAFRAAHAADPNAILTYNDYDIEAGAKHEKAMRLLKSLLAQEVPIQAVGIQGHWHIDSPDLANVERGIEDFASLGLKVMITELDVSVLPGRTNPYARGLPHEVSQRLAARYEQILEMFLRQKKDIGRVTFWGVHDGNSWLNNHPEKGRTDYPLLFDRQGKPKVAFYSVTEASGKIP
jgi:endo-1,4-beta-xylanase